MKPASEKLKKGMWEMSKKAMKRPDKLKLTLCSGLPYGLKGQFQVRDVIPECPDELRVKVAGIDSARFFIKYCKPILRSMEDLTKGITQDGKTFVPMAELAKLFHVNERFETTHYGDCKILDRWYTIKCYVENDNDRYMDYSVRRENVLSNRFDVIQKLIEWHFNVLNLDPDDFIDVNTLKQNCYA